MALITLDNIAGDPPYNIFVCDVFQNLCVSALTYYDYIPPSYSFDAPSQFTYAPQLLIKINVNNLNNYVFRTISK